VAVKFADKNSMNLENESKWVKVIDFYVSGNRDVRKKYVIRHDRYMDLKYGTALIMKYYPLPLSELVSQKKSSLQLKRHILYGVALGIDILHTAEIAHMDLKTDNILLDTSLQPVIADLGAAREAFAHVNNLIGTPIFMAPEMAGQPELLSLTKIYDNRAYDMWTLGFVMFEVLYEYTPTVLVSENDDPPLKFPDKSKLGETIMKDQFNLYT
jgi:serine/threonine protein kinase